MKATFYRESAVLTSYLEERGELAKYPNVYVPVHPSTGKKGRPDARFRVVPAGYTIEHPEAFWLVRQGVAKPADEECRERAGLNSEEIVRRFERQKLLEAGKLTGDPKLDAPDKA